CDISPAVEESDFWKFELCTLLLGLSSYAVVYLRQRKLDKRLMEKINKQIAAGI
ncbi:protein JTB, partial [Biomphalaria pfeifferi]